MITYSKRAQPVPLTGTMVSLRDAIALDGLRNGHYAVICSIMGRSMLPNLAVMAGGEIVVDSPAIGANWDKE